MSKPLIVFATDDGYISDYTIMYKEFKKRGISGTTFLVGESADTFRTNRMNWGLVNTIVDRGWDYQCHTYSHAYLDTITNSQVQSELNANDESFVKNGLPKPKHTAYPGGRINDSNKEVILQNRLSTRSARHETVPHPYNTYDGIRKGNDILGIGCDVQTENRFRQITNAVDETIANNGVLVLYWHVVTPRGSTPTNQYEITQDFMVRLLDYVINSDVQVMTYSEMYDYVNTI